MNMYKVGDVVIRKSYGGDVAFIVHDVINRDGKITYLLRGLLQRLEADSDGSDLVIQSSKDILKRKQKHNAKIRRVVLKGNVLHAMNLLHRARSKPGKILHIDSSKEFMDKCTDYYNEAKIESVAYRVDEREQPGAVRQLMERSNADILVLTGHDGFKKEGGGPDTVQRYRNSQYFIESVKEARKYEASKDKLCIFAGACQSYFEGIMAAGANFASSPGRILINALDPAIVSKRVAITDSRFFVTPQLISSITVSGRGGIGGINTRGHQK